MKIATISKKLIKPVNPTPPNLKNYYLSFIDESMPLLKLAVVLFYESKPENMKQLEESLAKILVQFYPLAGRYFKNEHLIDCSDEGVIFVEAEALDVELKNIENHKLNDLFADQDCPFDAPYPLLSIQVTHFPSGGLAVAVAVSHKVFDGWSFGMFISAWSNATNPDGKIAFTPSFHLPSLFPYQDRGSTDNTEYTDENIVVKRFMFDKVAITRLRSKLISPNRNGKTTSRVRVVSSVIAKTLIGMDRVKQGRTRDFMICQMINMRERTITPQPNNAYGNFAILSFTRCVAGLEGREVGMQELVDLIGDAIEKTIADNAQILCPHRDGREIIINNWENCIQKLSIPDTNIINFSDWSKFGFYETDFGWGKPIWVGIGPVPATCVNLMSNKGGDGIEARIYLKKDDVHYFEQDEEIKHYAI